MTEKNWDFECPTFIDFNDPNTWESNDKENDAFFDVDQKFKESHLPITTKMMSSPISGENDANITQFKTPKKDDMKSLVNTSNDEEIFFSATKEAPYPFRETSIRNMRVSGMTPCKEPRSEAKSRRKSRKIATEFRESLNKTIENSCPLVVEDSGNLTFSIDSSEDNKVSDITVCHDKVSNIEESVNDKSDSNTLSKGIEEGKNGCAFDEVANLLQTLDKVRLSTTFSPKKTIRFSESQCNRKPSQEKGNLLKRKKEYRVTPLSKKVIKLASSKKDSVSKNTKIHITSFTPRIFQATSSSKNVTTYKTMGELIKEFDTKPRSKNTTNNLPVDSKRFYIKPTSPQLQAVHRNRKSTFLSRNDIEEELMKQMNKQTFKATPINKKLFEPNFKSSIPKRSERQCTTPLAPNFETDKRLALRRSKLISSTETLCSTTFRAQPMPSYRSTKCTKPMTEKKPIVQKLFSFVEQDVGKWLERQENIRKNENGVIKEHFEFKAQPCKAIYGHGFKPKKIDNKPIDFVPFNLYTDKRADERVHLNGRKLIKELKAAPEIERKRLEEIERVKEEIRLYRSGLVHKPQEFKRKKLVAVRMNKATQLLIPKN